MASMEDLIATISGGMHVGQQGSDLKDLHAELAQTLQPTIPTPSHRPIPPPQTSAITSPTGPMPPPPPASSWNDAADPNPSRQPIRETGFTIPPVRPTGVGGGGAGGGEGGGGGGRGEMPYHASVLPVRASPKDMGGFGDDAFRPLWRKEGEKGWGGFTNGDRR